MLYIFQKQIRLVRIYLNFFVVSVFHNYSIYRIYISNTTFMSTIYYVYSCFLKYWNLEFVPLPLSSLQSRSIKIECVPFFIHWKEIGIYWFDLLSLFNLCKSASFQWTKISIVLFRFSFCLCLNTWKMECCHW